MSELNLRSHSNPRVREHSQSDPRRSHLSLDKPYKELAKLREIPSRLNEMSSENDDQRHRSSKSVNKLLVEIDRITQERNELAALLQEEKSRAGDFIKNSKTSGKAKNIVDRNLQSELKYEKEEGVRLRHLLSQIENQRAEMMSRIKDYEISASASAYERQEMNLNIEEMRNRADALEKDKTEALTVIKQINERVLVLNNEKKSAEEEKNRFLEALQQIEAEKREIYIRYNDETDKFKKLLLVKQQEMDDIKWVHHKHTQVLASKNIYLEIHNLVKKILSHSLIQILQSNKHEAAKSLHINKLIVIPEKYFFRKQKYFFDVWSSSLNWKGTQQTRLNLIDSHFSKNLKIRSFRFWRSQYSRQINCRNNKRSSTLLLIKLMKNHLVTTLNSRLNIWRKHVFNEKYKKHSIKALVLKYFPSKIKRYLKTWFKFTVYSALKQAQDDLATDFSSLLVKTKFISALKEHTKVKRLSRELKAFKNHQSERFYKLNMLNDLSRYARYKNQRKKILIKINKNVYMSDLKKAINEWKQIIKRYKNVKKLEIFFNNSNKIMIESYKDRLFYVWKQYFMSNRLKLIKDELSIEKPRRIQLEAELTNFTQESIRLKHITASRVFARLLKLDLLSYFVSWKNITSNFKKSLPRVNNLIMREYYKKIAEAYRRWRQNVKDKNILTLIGTSAKQQKENYALVDHIENLELVLEENLTQKQNLSKIIMRKVMDKLANFMILKCLRQWARNALKLSNKSVSAGMLQYSFIKVKLSRSFASIKQFSVIRKIKEMNQRKINKISKILVKDSLNLTFLAWKKFIKTIKVFRSLIIKIKNRSSLVFKQIFINRWKSIMHYLKESEIKDFAHGISIEKNIISENLSKVSIKYNEELATSSKYLKKLNKRARMRLANALARCSKLSLQNYLAKWKSSLDLKSLKLLKTKNLFRLGNQHILKRSWRSWIIHTKNKIIFINQQEIVQQIRIKKAANREAKEVQSRLESEIQLKESDIKILNKSLENQERINEYLLDRSVKQFESDYSESRASFAFKIMKNRFLTIKSTVTHLIKRINLIQKRKALADIFQTVKEQIFIANFKNVLIDTFEKYSQRYLRYLFDKWLRNSFERQSRLLQLDLKKTSAQMNKIINTRKVEKNNYQKNTLLLLRRNTKKNMFVNWVKITQKIANIRRSQIAYQNLSFSKNTKKALALWNIFVNTKKNSKNKASRSSKFNTIRLISKIFKLWKLRFTILKSFYSISSFIQHTFYRESTMFALSMLKSSSTLHKLSVSRLSSTKKLLLRNIISKMFKSNIFTSFNMWRNSLYSLKSRCLITKRILYKGLHRKYKLCMIKWKENYLISEVTKKVNNSGTVAIENVLLKERNDVLSKLIVDEGIDARYVERYINERETLNAALRRKGINYAKYRTGQLNMQDSYIIPKYLLMWKLWTTKRKRISKYSKRILAFRHKPDLMHAFLLWKKGFALIVNTVSKYPRRQLYSLIAKLDRDVKIIETRLEEANNEVVYMKAYSGILEEHARRGQNLAISVSRNNIQKTYYRAFMRWIIHSNLCKVHDLIKSLMDTEEQLLISQSNFKAISEDYNELNEANLQLRQASLDGVAIAEAFETLSRERERLSTDLAERTATVKKLMEYNSQLTFRLKQFGAYDKGETSEMPRYKKH